MNPYKIKADGTFVVRFKSPSSEIPEHVFGQNAIRLRAFVAHHRYRAVNILVEYSKTGVVPYGRHIDETINCGNVMMAIRMNSIDERPYMVDPLTAEKIAVGICEYGVDHTIELLDMCREAVYQPIYLQWRDPKAQLEVAETL